MIAKTNKIYKKIYEEIVKRLETSDVDLDRIPHFYQYYDPRIQELKTVDEYKLELCDDDITNKTFYIDETTNDVYDEDGQLIGSYNSQEEMITLHT